MRCRSCGYALKAGQLTYDCRYSTMHGMPVTGSHGFRGLKPLWYNGVPHSAYPVVQEILRKGPGCSAASINQCSTVFGSTSNTRAVPRMPKPSARQPITCTMRSTETRLPWNRVP